MERFESSIEVDCPVRTVYNQWTQFEAFPGFMDGVEQVLQLDDTHLYWRATVGGKTKDWEAEITEQVPDQRIAWKSKSGARNAGSVHFDPLGTDRTRVSLKIGYDPQGLTENLGDALGVVSRQIEATLRDFKSFIEQRGGETGAWRGEVHPRRAADPGAWRGEAQHSRAGDSAAAAGEQPAGSAARSEETEARHADDERADRGELLSRPGSSGPLDLLEEPFGPIRRIGSDMERALASGSLTGPGGADEPRLWSPHVDVAQRGDEFVVVADLPGVKRDDVTLEVEGNALILQGERRRIQSDGRGIFRFLCEGGAFYCAIPLPDSADSSSARASMDSGVLRITLHAPSVRRCGRRVTIEGA